MCCFIVFSPALHNMFHTLLWHDTACLSAESAVKHEPTNVWVVFSYKYVFSLFKSCCQSCTLDAVVCCSVCQVSGLAPPGVVIPQLSSALRAAAPGPPGVVIPQLATAPPAGSCYFLIVAVFFISFLSSFIMLMHAERDAVMANPSFSPSSASTGPKRMDLSSHFWPSGRGTILVFSSLATITKFQGEPLSGKFKWHAY